MAKGKAKEKAEQAREDARLIEASGINWPPDAKVTPMMRQWLSAKAQSPSSILLFRMGDFYELFGEDAVAAAPVLELALTSRDKGKNGFPMAGFPHHAAPAYIAKLIEAGLKVAVCDQMEDPALAKGIVKRDITRIVTPGLILEDESLTAGNNNYLIAICGEAPQVGLAALDLSTGDFVCTVSSAYEQVWDEVLRLNPAELLMPDSAVLKTEFERVQRAHPGALKCRIEWLGSAKADQKIFSSLGLLDAHLESETYAPGRLAAALILGYVKETQNALPPHLSTPRPYAIDHQLIIDDTTRMHLNLVGPPGRSRKKGTLLWALDQTFTAMGARHLKRRLLAPSTSIDEITAWHEEVTTLVENPAITEGLKKGLKEVYDLERLTARVASQRASPRDLGQLRKSLRALPELQKSLKIDRKGPLGSRAKVMDVLADVYLHLDAALAENLPLTQKEGGLFKPGFDKDLDEVVELATGGRQAIVQVEDQERERTGIPNLKVKHTRVFGYYIEVTRSHLARVPEHYRRKQTVANGERFITEELKSLEERVASAEVRRHAKEAQLFEQLRSFLASHAQRFLKVAREVAALDVALSFATVSQARNYRRPEVLPASRRHLTVQQGRHPVLELLSEELSEPFVPNDVTLDHQERQMLLITGPNMAGKSTVMRQVALTQILAQMGCYVPASHAAMSLCDRVFARVGASDDLARGRSTFMVEMAETSHILKNATPFSLVLLDEIGRGTSTYDGLAIAWAVTEYLHQQVGARTLFATHYHELTALDQTLEHLKNMHVAVHEKDQQITFLRLLKEGPAGRSYGVHVGKLAGLPAEVTDRATDLLVDFEKDEGVKHAPFASMNQLQLFNGAPSSPEQGPPHAEHWLETEVQALDLNSLTPLEALNALARLQASIDPPHEKTTSRKKKRAR